MNTIDGKLPLPLKGIRVLDATHIVAGPFCSLILADMGAEVIKIERPGTGDLSRGRGPFIQGEDGQEISSRYLGVNRNKKSVTLDLRNPLCKSAFENLVRKSDVLIDNWGPGAFERLMCAADFYFDTVKEIAFIGDPDAPDTKKLVRTLYDRYLPNKIVVGAAEAQSDPSIPLLKGKTRIQGKPTAYVCEGYRCKLPVHTPQDLAKQLEAK